jgi:hypothetical protein
MAGFALPPPGKTLVCSTRTTRENQAENFEAYVWVVLCSDLVPLFEARIA